MKNLSYVLVAILSLSGLAIAGQLVMVAPVSVSVPAFTPWGTIIIAAVLGISGFYAISEKRK